MQDEFEFDPSHPPPFKWLLGASPRGDRRNDLRSENARLPDRRERILRVDRRAAGVTMTCPNCEAEMGFDLTMLGTLSTDDQLCLTCPECGHSDDPDCDCEYCCDGCEDCPWCVDGELCEEHGGEETSE